MKTAWTAALPLTDGSLPGQVVQALRDEARESVSVSDLMAQLQSLQNQVAATHERAHELARPPGPLWHTSLCSGAVCYVRHGV